MRAKKSLCPVCRRAYSPKRGCRHRFDRPPLPTLHTQNGTSVKLRPIAPLLGSDPKAYNSATDHRINAELAREGYLLPEAVR